MIFNSILIALGIKKPICRLIDYQEWITSVEQPLYKNIKSINAPEVSLVSIILSVNSVRKSDLIKNTVSSIINQTSPNWELIIVADGDIDSDDAFLKDGRITVIQKKPELGLYYRINEAAQLAQGNLITFLCEGDTLSVYAVSLISECKIDNNSVKIIYSDEDLLDSNENRCKPIFKPDWNPDYLDSYNYLSNAVVYEKNLFLEMGMFNSDAKDPKHFFALNAVKQIDKNHVQHLDRVLFHFKSKAKTDIHRIQYEVPKPEPLISIVVPTKDHLSLLKICLDGLLNNTHYNNIEIIIIDNLSEEVETIEYLRKISNHPKIRILNYDKVFNFSEMNNLAVKAAEGSIICFLNNDISIFADDWLTEMVSQASRKEIGCVGAKLFYPDGTIQHAGVILGLKGYASHAHKGFAGDSDGYCKRLIVSHNVSAVTAACLVMRKAVFEEVGGFDAVNLKIAYNDVDLCLKAREAGYRNLFTPHAKLIHHESKSRGKKRNRKQQIQLRAESSYLLEKWGDTLVSDPAYNKNLTLVKEDFSLGFDRVKE